MNTGSAAGAAAIRRARLLDLGRVYQTVRHSFVREFVDPFDIFLALITPWIHVLVAEQDGHMIGTTMVIPMLFEPLAWISTVGVVPEYRRRGIARELLRAAERIVPRRRLRLEVYADNDGAITLYAQLGYREIRRYRGDGRERVEMEKDLG